MAYIHAYNPLYTPKTGFLPHPAAISQTVAEALWI